MLAIKNHFTWSKKENSVEIDLFIMTFMCMT